MSNHEEPTYPSRDWSPLWGEHLFLSRFGGDTPFHGPTARDHLHRLAHGFAESTPVEPPSGADFRRAREAVGLSPENLRAIFQLDPGLLRTVEEGERNFNPGLLTHDNGWLAFCRVCGALWSFLSHSEAKARRAEAKREAAEEAAKAAEEATL